MHADDAVGFHNRNPGRNVIDCGELLFQQRAITNQDDLQFRVLFNCLNRTLFTISGESSREKQWDAMMRRK